MCFCGGIRPIVIGMLHAGLNADWLKSLSVSSQYSRSSGLPPGKIQVMRQYGIIKAAVHKSKDVIQWGPGVNYGTAMKFLEGEC